MYINRHVCVRVCTLACFSLFVFSIHGLSLHVTSVPYVELGWPLAHYHELILIHSLSVIPELPHDCKCRDPPFLFPHTSSLGPQRPHSAQKWLEEKGQVEVIPRLGHGGLTAEWKFILGSHGQKTELGAVLDSCNSQGTHGSVLRTGWLLSIQLARTCLLKALLLLCCITKRRLHKFWLRRSRALKAKRSGVRDVSEHLCWVLWNNRRLWRDAHSLEAISRAVLELTRGGTIAMLCSYWKFWFKVKAVYRNSLWKKATPSTLSYYRSLVPFDSWFQRSLSGQTLSIHPQSHFSEPSMAPRELGQGNSHLFSCSDDLTSF